MVDAIKEAVGHILEVAAASPVVSPKWCCTAFSAGNAGSTARAAEQRDAGRRGAFRRSGGARDRICITDEQRQVFQVLKRSRVLENIQVSSQYILGKNEYPRSTQVIV